MPTWACISILIVQIRRSLIGVEEGGQIRDLVGFPIHLHIVCVCKPVEGARERTERKINERKGRQKKGEKRLTET